MKYWPHYDNFERAPRPIIISAAASNDDSETVKKRSRARKKRKEKKRSCPCGDPAKIRDLVESYGKSSTLHGAVYFTSKHGKRCVCFWRFLLVFCFIGVIASVVVLISDAIGSSSVSISTIRRKAVMGRKHQEDFPTYPGITICRMPSYETGDQELETLYDYASTSLGYPFAALTVLEKSILFGNHFHPEEVQKFKEKVVGQRESYKNYTSKTPGFNMKQFLIDSRVRCDAVFVDCILEMIALNCCELFRPVLTTLGTCYVLEPNEDFQFVNEATREIEGFSFYIDLLSPLRTGSDHLLGFSVFVSDPFVEPVYMDFTKGIMVSPGYVATISLSLIMTNRREFYETWYGIGGECPKLPRDFEPDETRRERYSRNMCLLKYTTGRMKEDCKCLPVLEYEENERPQMRICKPEDFVQCFATSFLKENGSGMKKHCQAPCIEYTYRDQVSYATLDVAEGSAAKSRIVIHYHSEEYVYNEYQRFTISTFFSQIGGTMGLLLGASIITSIEFVAFILKLIWYRFVPFRRQKIGDKRLY